MKFNLFNQKPVIFKLKNGLTVHLICENSHQTYVELDVSLGSFNQNYKIDDETYQIIPGAAHFLEHKMFSMPDGDAFKRFYELGVTSNALTTYRQTSYTLNGNKDMLEATLYLLKMIDTPHFTDENIISEQKIIQEEIQMYDDEPDTIIYQKMYQSLLWHHPMIHEITGSKADVTKIDKRHLTQIYEDFYQHSNRQLLILGPIVIDDYVDALKAYDSDDKPIRNILNLDVFEPKIVKSKEDTIYVDHSIPVLSIGFKYQQKNNDEETLFRTETAMFFLARLIFGSNTEFTEKLISDGIINEPFDMQINMEDQTMVFVMDVTTEDTHKLKELVLETFFKNAEASLNHEAFELLKRAYLGSYLMAVDDIENRLYLYGKYYMNHMSFEDAVDILKNFELNDVISLYHAFNLDMITFIHALPKSLK